MNKDIYKMQTPISDITFSRQYIITLLLKPSLKEDDVVEMIKNHISPLKDICNIQEVKMCGKKRTTHLIQKQEYAIYSTILIEVSEDDNKLKAKLDEISRRIKSMSDVIRFLVCRYSQKYNKTLSPENLSQIKPYLDKTVK